VRRLIINADDFGLTAGVNRAIREAHSRGIVTSTTVMANSRAFEGAADLVSDVQTNGSAPISIGCHVVLVDGEPLLPAEQVSTLLDPRQRNRQPHFRDSLNDFVVASFRHMLDPAQIEAEATAQMQRVQGAGIHLSHFDTHKHAHMFPAVLRPLLRAARACGISAVRNPFGQVWPLPLTGLLRTRRLWKRFAQLNVLRNFAANFRREVEAHGLRTTDGSVGVLVPGELDLKLFTAVAESMPEGTWEFVCHPGYNDADLDKVQTRLRQSREQELRLLTSAEAKEVLRRQKIDLISYNEL
jgi:predicted glycoside hydrolase/deacetylase ChbG (UPF0249 family)